MLRSQPVRVSESSVLISFSAGTPELTHVDLAGVTRSINVALLIEEDLGAGDWTLIHAGFAMEKIDEATAMSQIVVLRDYTGHPEEEGGTA